MVLQQAQVPRALRLGQLRDRQRDGEALQVEEAACGQRLDARVAAHQATSAAVVTMRCWRRRSILRSERRTNIRLSTGQNFHQPLLFLVRCKQRRYAGGLLRQDVHQQGGSGTALESAVRTPGMRAPAGPNAVKCKSTLCAAPLDGAFTRRLWVLQRRHMIMRGMMSILIYATCA